MGNRQRPVSSQSGQRKRSLAVPVLLVVLLILGAVFGLVFVQDTQPMREREVQARRAHVVVDQGLNFFRAFRQMRALGFEADSITFNDGGEADLYRTHNLIRTVTLPAAMLREAEATWEIGGGQILGAFNRTQPDIAMFHAGLTLEACQQINAYLWNADFDAAPPASGTDVAAWRIRRADLLQLFAGLNRSEGCIATIDDDYLFYKVVLER